MAATLVLAPAGQNTGNDSSVRIFGSNDDGTVEIDDTRDELSWNPPAFAAGSSTRGLTFELNSLPAVQTVTILLENLALTNPNTPPISQSKQVQGPTAKVTFPKDSDPPKSSNQIIFVGGQPHPLKPYHLNGMPDACMLYRATASSDPDTIHETYHYWTLSDNIVLTAATSNAPNGNDSNVEIYVTDDSGKNGDQRDKPSWNPPAFIGNGPRDLTFELKNLSVQSITIVLQDLCEPQTSVQSLAVAVSQDGTATVLFPRDNSLPIKGPAILRTNKKGQLIPYHLGAQSGSLFLVTVCDSSDLNAVQATYYYWTMDDSIIP